MPSGTRRAGVVPHHEPTRVLREGGRESERANTTGEAGEPPRGTLWREEARRVSEPQEGKMAEISSSTTVPTKQERIAMLARQMPFRTCYASGCEMELRLAANH